MARFHVMGMAALAGLVGLAGCDGGPWEEGGAVWLTAVEGDQVYFEHYETYSGWEILPSSLWVLNTTTGESRRLQEPVPQAGLQVEGDYYVTEEVLDGEQRGQVVIVQLSTGRRTVIYERSHEPATSWPAAHIVNGGRVAVLTDAGLVIYDLATATATHTIDDLPADVQELAAFRGDRALLTRGTSCCVPDSAMLVNVSTGERTQIPAAPGSLQPFYLDPQLSADHLAVSRTEKLDAQTSRNEILLLDIPTLSWRVLAEYEPFTDLMLFSSIVFVRGLDGQQVLVERLDFGLIGGGSHIELIDIETGERHVVAEPVRNLLISGPVDPVLGQNQVLWIGPFADTLVIHDLTSGQEQTLPLGVPTGG